jgi:hypothetical protein
MQKLRKKLTMTIVGLVVNWVGVWLAQKGIELTPEQQTTLYEFGIATSGLIILAFNIGQGIADKGKEVGKQLLIFILIGSLIGAPGIVFAQDTCPDDLKAAEELMDEQAAEIEAVRSALAIVLNDKETLEEVVADLREQVETCSTGNRKDGDISLADILEKIPGFAKLPKEQRTLIITIALGIVALGLSYIPMGVN